MRHSPYPDQAKRPGLVLERRFVAAFGRLLQELGMGNRRADEGLLDLLEKASQEVRRLKERIADAETPPYVTNEPPPEIKDHHVQFRALDLDDQVHIRGEWMPEHQTNLAEARVRNEMLALQSAGIDLRIVKYVRCSRLNLTKVAEEEPPF